MKLESKDILRELEAKVDLYRKEYEEARSALAVFRRLFENDYKTVHPVPESKTTEATIDDSGEINLSAFNLPERTKPTISETIRGLLKKFGTQEFTVGHIYAILQNQDAVPDVKSPKASIAQALSVLEVKGDVIRTFRGTGNTPHKFKVSEKFFKEGSDADAKEKAQ